MAENITIARLNNLIAILNKETGDVYDFSLDQAYGGYRLVRKRESVDVSPRMSKTELYYWIHALRQGVEFGKGYIRP